MAQAYGSITIVDIGDLGRLSVFPESNQPAMVVYDPDGGSYSPSWSSSNPLILSPNIYYGAEKLSVDSSVEVIWKKRIDSGKDSIITSGVENGILTIKENAFAAKEGKPKSSITYTLEVKYTEPNSKAVLTALGQISFSLISNAPSVKRITVSGPAAFLQDGTGKEIVPSITLTATLQNTSFSKWCKLKTENGAITEEDIPGAINSTLIVTPDSKFFADGEKSITLRAKAINSGVYDDHTIIRIKDGANGNNNLSAVLTNEQQAVPSKQDGTVESSALADAFTEIKIYDGNKEVTSEWTISKTYNDVTDSQPVNSSKVVITSFTKESETGYVDFVCTKKGQSPLTKRYNIIKVKTGIDGKTPVIYSLKLDTLAINQSADGRTYTPNQIIAQAFKQVGDVKEPYAGRFKITVDDSTVALTSKENKDTLTWDVAGVTKKFVIELYQQDSELILLDKQTVVITSDGQQGNPGDPGAPGADAVNFVLGNQSDIIPCDNSGLVIEATTITIPCEAFIGIVKKPCMIAIKGQLPAGMTQQGVGAQANQLVLNIAPRANLGNKDSGVIQLELSLSDSKNSATSKAYYRWSKSKESANAVLFQIYAPTGNIISNGENNVTLKTLITDGKIEDPQGSEYQWYKYTDQYDIIPQASTNQLIVKPEDVNGYASFKCIVTYNGKEYNAYFSVYDKTDPLQVSVISTVGDKIVNSQGAGIVYAEVYRNGKKIDIIKTLDSGYELPSGATSPNGDSYFYLLNKINMTAVLYQYIGGTWQISKESYKGKYNWTIRDKNNNLTSRQLEGKAIYVDSKVIDERATFSVEVNI